MGRRSQYNCLSVFVGDSPPGRAAQTSRKGRIRGDNHGIDAPSLDCLSPRTLELIRAGELVEEFFTVEISPAVDKDWYGWVKPVDEVPAPVVVVEDSARGGMSLKKRDGAGRKMLRHGLLLALDHLENVDTGKGGHGEQDECVGQGLARGRRTQLPRTACRPVSEPLA